MFRFSLLRRTCVAFLAVVLTIPLGVLGSTTAMATPATQSSQQATITGHEQFLVDPVGGILSHIIFSSSEVLASDPRAFMAASMFSMGEPGEGIGLPAFDRCAHRFSSSTSVQAVRFVSAGLCAMLDLDSRAEIARVGF